MKNLSSKTYHPKSAQSGFTLIETLTAVTILSFSIVSLLVVTSQGVANANLAKNKFIATYLSSESVEILRNMRDSRGWIEFLVEIEPCDITQNLNGCIVDSSSLTSSSDKWVVVPCDETGCPYAFNEEKTVFFRSIKIESLQGGDEIKVISEVWWNQGNVRKNVLMGENLFNWQ